MSGELALSGGTPIRSEVLPYGRHSIDDDDVEEVARVLRSDWLTTGPKIEEFERTFADGCGTREAVAVSSGTAALHACMHALDIGPGDEVIVPPITFAASANCVLYSGGTPVFADVDPETLLLDPDAAVAKITPRTRAIVAVDYAGQPCDYTRLREIAEHHGIALVADACHALGAEYEGRRVGSLGDLNVFSFHPVKHITMGEGGVISTDDAKLARRMRTFRTHGITSDHRQREEDGSWYYEMVDLGWNYRVTDMQCALGLSQLRKLPAWVDRRREIAAAFTEDLARIEGIRPLDVRGNVRHAFHLFVVALAPEMDRAWVFSALRAEGIGVNVHYIPVHLHPYYREHLGTGPGLCPVAESMYERIITLPLFPKMTDSDVDDVLKALRKVARHLGTG